MRLLVKIKTPLFLDVGCGSGRLIYSLKEQGYQNVTGIDPYIERDISYKNGVEIQRTSLHELNGKWDVVMLHHVFEHLSDPYVTIRKLADLVKPGGVLLIRIPIFPNFAWEQYGTNWVQLDAPRHIYIHSLKSFQFLINDSKLEIEKIVYDSMPFQFLASEQYKRNISLFSEKSYMVNKSDSIFTRKDFSKFKRYTKVVNQNKTGDQVSIYLRLKNS